MFPWGAADRNCKDSESGRARRSARPALISRRIRTPLKLPTERGDWAEGEWAACDTSAGFLEETGLAGPQA